MCYRECNCLSFFVELVALFFFLLGIATPYWANSADGTIHTGLFQACPDNAPNCYDTLLYYDAITEKGQIVASAVLEVFALMGMLTVITLTIFYLCGLFDEKPVGRWAFTTAYLSTTVGMTGVILMGVTMTSLSYTLDWSFALAIVGLLIQIVAGVSLCVGMEN